MSLVIPNTAEVVFLQKILNEAVTIRIFGNNATPSATSVAGDFNEIAGGGYANVILASANWGYTAGNPSYALQAKVTWTFTGAINAPGTIYGYFITRNADGTLWWAERFPPAAVPFTPIAGSIVEVTPKFTGSSVY